MTWVLLWSARSSDISSRAAKETNLPRARHKWTGGGLGEVEGFAEAPGYQKITPEKIQMQLDTEEIEMGIGERDGKEGWESYREGRR